MVMMLDGITKKVCVNYEQIIPKVERSAGYDSDDKGLDWRAMNVIVAAEEKTLDVTQTLRLAEPSDNARARGIVCGYATDKNTFLAEAHDDDSTLTIELAAIENSIGHSGNKM